MAGPLPMAGIQESLRLHGGFHSAEKGTLRPSRTPRVLARFVRMVNSHVLSEDRPSKRSIPWSTPSHVSCTTSSATARLGTYSIASRNRGV